MTGAVSLLETLQQAVPLAGFTSFRVGGLAQFYDEPASVEAIATAWQWARLADFPVTFLGAGSNLLIRDRKSVV